VKISENIVLVVVHVVVSDKHFNDE